MSTALLTASAVSFEEAYRKEFEGRNLVSEGMHAFLRSLVILLTSCAVAMAAFYGIQLGESWWFKLVIVLTAVCIECSIVFFSAVIYPKGVITSAQIVAGVLLPLLSLFTFMSFMISQQYAADHKVTEMAAEYMGQLKEDTSRLSAVKKEDRGSLAATRDRFEAMLDRFGDKMGSKATAIYDYISHVAGWSKEGTVLLVRFLWALCLVCLSISLDAYVDTRLATKKMREKWVENWEEEQAFIARHSPKGRVVNFQPVQEFSEDGGEVEESDTEETDEERTARFRRQKGEGRELSEEVYQRIKSKLLSGEISPSVAAVKKEARGSDNAYQAIDRLQKEGVVYQGENGRYLLASGHAVAA
jgi:hypothetical protein